WQKVWFGVGGGGGGVPPPPPPTPPENHILASKGDLCHSIWVKRAKKRAFDIGGVWNAHPDPFGPTVLLKRPFYKYYFFSIAFGHLFLCNLHIKERLYPPHGWRRVAFLSRPAIFFPFLAKIW